MSRFLFVQTAFQTHEVAIVEDATLIRVFQSSSARDTVQFLQTTLLSLVDLSFDALVFVAGPGSFTALRVGATWVNTIAFVRQIPVVTVTSLEYISWLQSVDAGGIALSFDDVRYFSLSQGQLIVSEQPSTLTIVRPDQLVVALTVVVAARLELLVQSADQSHRSTDVLYVLPPKITQRKK